MRRLAALALLVPVAAAAQMGGGMMRGREMMNSSRHAYVMRHGVDPKYAQARNPLEPSASNIEAGRKLYRLYCALCHGDIGLGSEAGRELDPPAASLAATCGSGRSDQGAWAAAARLRGEPTRAITKAGSRRRGRRGSTVHIPQ